MKFRKKPVVIEAVQWNGKELAEVPQWMSDAIQKMPGETGGVFRVGGDVHVFTLEGTMIAKPGYWIIRGVAGELYPCKPDIFAATYEPADAARRRPQGDAMSLRHDIEMARHWIDRYAAGIDDEPNMDAIADALTHVSTGESVPMSEWLEAQHELNELRAEIARHEAALAGGGAHVLMQFRYAGSYDEWSICCKELESATENDPNLETRKLFPRPAGTVQVTDEMVAIALKAHREQSIKTTRGKVLNQTTAMRAALTAALNPGGSCE